MNTEFIKQINYTKINGNIGYESNQNKIINYYY